MRQGIRTASERGAHIEVRSLEGVVSKDALKTVYDACDGTRPGDAGTERR
jgi:hypothetical protein